MDHIAGIKQILHVLGSYSRVLSELMIKGQSTSVLVDSSGMGGSMGEDPGEQCEGRMISLIWAIFEVC